LKNKINIAVSQNQRHSIRLPGYDYSSPGGYFLTIATFSRDPIFGEIIDGEMVLSAFGKIASDEWLKTPSIRKEIDLGNFVIMPDHIHVVFWIRDDQKGPVAGASGRTPLPFRIQPKSVGALVAGYKSAVTKRINLERNTPGVPVWQRNYYEHIIRDDRDLHRIDQYIENNPLMWHNEVEW
jgi:REP element-mobilizing transposase RayT